MHISPLEEYALRCAVQLAKADAGGMISASQIAELEGISSEYVSKIMFLFRKAGLVEATRGVQGGFRLTREAGQIPLKAVLDALLMKKTINDQFCSQFSGQNTECAHLECCSVRPVWTILSSYFDGLLSALNLADLTENESFIRKKIQNVAFQKASEIHVGGTA